MPSIRKIVGGIQGLVDWLNRLDEGTKKIIVTIALVAVAIAPVLIVIGKVVGAVGIIMTVILCRLREPFPVWLVLCPVP